jgi:hypothetical protein
LKALATVSAELVAADQVTSLALCSIGQALAAGEVAVAGFLPALTCQ